MDKGIRPYCNNKFVELNEQRRRGLVSNLVFRKTVMADVMEQFGCTLASAATHYNHAFKTVKELNGELVSGLGRAEDKKGGRKKKAVVVAAAVAAILGLPRDLGDAGSTSDVLNSTLLGNGGEEQDTEQAPPAGVLLSEGVKENTSTQTVTTNPPVKYSVRKVSDGTVVCEDLTLEQANALIAKAAAAKKAKLQLVA